MRLPLNETRRDDSVAHLDATLPPQSSAVAIRYKTRLGALLRVDGAAAGAYDLQHHDVIVPPSDNERVLQLEVELHALPTSGLPGGPNIVWWYFNARSHAEPRRFVEVREASTRFARSAALRVRGGRSTANAPQDDTDITLATHHDLTASDALRVFGHSHLDVAWLWTYEETKRKAQRTFAIACDLLERDGGFRYIQSQPQLYAFVQEADPELFKRVLAYVSLNRFDARVAALWVESDCNLPSGESLLRQMLLAHEYCKEHLGVVPTVAWLPDSFGFANTLPQLLAHCGIEYFATTKLQWNDTTKFAHPQFVWQGPDGSRVTAALLAGYAGPAYPWRVKAARERDEPLALGYGDGGGGVTESMLSYAQRRATWIDFPAWLAEIAARKASLPVHKDELYLEYHRGVYTTHHDIKMHNALCERALDEAEELLAWCTAVHAPRRIVADMTGRLNDAWRIVLRNQFHDVLPGTAIAAVYADARDEYAHAEEWIASVIASAETMLPRATAAPARSPVAPREDGEEFIFENAYLFARVRRSGAIVELRTPDGPNVCAQSNVLALYRDKPKAWEAWNIDGGYEKHMRAARPANAHIEDGALIVDFNLGGSTASMRLQLFADEPFLRAGLDVDWRERRTLLRVENWLALASTSVTYGSPHGCIVRSAHHDTPALAAKFEVPGQRYAYVCGERAAGMAMFALDTYGWSAKTLPKGGVKLGHSLLRGTTWPDPQADAGEHSISYAYAPIANGSVEQIETIWRLFAHERRVRLFTTQTPGIVVTACKPAQDGDGVIVRVRECNGTAANVRLRCGARMTWALSVDGLERATHGAVSVEGESLAFDLGPYALRSFRVRFSHA